MMYIKGTVTKIVEKQAKSGNYYSIIGIQSSAIDRDGFETQYLYKLPVYANRASEGLPAFYLALIGQEVLAPFTFNVDSDGRLSYFLDGLPEKPSMETFAPQRVTRAAELVAQAREARGAPPVQPQSAQAAPTKSSTAQG